MENVDYYNEIKKLIEKLENNQLNWDNIPYEFLMNELQNTYISYGNIGTNIVNNYGNQIIDVIKKQDVNGLVRLLSNFTYHRILISSLEQQRAMDADKIRKKCVELAFYRNLEYNEEWIKKNRKEKIKNYHPFEGKGVVYTAITGNYDYVKEPEFINPNLDYLLFTNNPNIKSNVWNVIIIKNEGLDNVRLSKKIKILAHEYVKEYDYSIWIDGKIKILGDLEDFLMKERQYLPMLCFNHYYNDCIYDEFLTCCSLKKDAELIMKNQIEKYRKEGYPCHYGLTELAVIVREHNNRYVRKCMEKWWNEVLHGSYRDQLSFKYACWKTDTIYDTTKLIPLCNQYMQTNDHL